MLRRFARWCLTSMALAGWQLYGLPIYKAYLESQGKIMGFWELTFSYLAVFIITWLVGWIFLREKDGDKS